MLRTPSRIIAAACFALALVPRGAPAQSFTAETAGRIDFRSGAPGAETAAIWGYLALPPGTGRVPAMVLMHGSSGLNAGSRVHYSELLNRYGIAAFYVDSFTGRGISSTVQNQAVLSYADNTRDAFVALRLLRQHPRIDPAKIGVMGFSRDGTVSWASSIRDGYAQFRREGLTRRLGTGVGRIANCREMLRCRPRGAALNMTGRRGCLDVDVNVNI